MTEQKSIPIYKLYGESDPWPMADMVHCESIAARSRLHNWHIATHQHNGLFQILYLVAGSAKIQLDDLQYEMKAGQILMLPQMCVHGFKFKRDAIGHVVTIAYPLIQNLMQQLRPQLIQKRMQKMPQSMGESRLHAGDKTTSINNISALTVANIHALKNDEESRYIQAAFTMLDNEYRGRLPHRAQLIESLLASILIWLTRSETVALTPANALQKDRLQNKLSTAVLSQTSTRRGTHFPRFSELIELHYTTHQAVSYYADQLGITAAHLNALCRQTVGQSALGLIHERLTLEAKRNLVYTSMSISVLSYTLGFSDPSYFTRFFKRQVGLSPKEFKQKVGTSA